jgi:predicted Fe-Mo cluster-binding NifX family protein
MKIALVTDDGKTISAHFGRAATYAVITVEDGRVMAREQRAKPAHGPGHHHQQASEGTVQLHEGSAPSAGVEPENMHGAMVAPITDCQVLISRGMGAPAYESLRAAGLQPIITDVRDIDEAVSKYLDGKLEDHPEQLH